MRGWSCSQRARYTLRVRSDSIVSTLDATLRLSPAGKVIDGQNTKSSTCHAHPDDRDFTCVRNDRQNTAITPGATLDIDIVGPSFNHCVRKVVRLKRTDRLFVHYDGRSISCARKSSGFSANVQASLSRNSLKVAKPRFDSFVAILNSGAPTKRDCEEKSKSR